MSGAEFVYLRDLLLALFFFPADELFSCSPRLHSRLTTFPFHALLLRIQFKTIVHLFTFNAYLVLRRPNIFFSIHE